MPQKNNLKLEIISTLDELSTKAEAWDKLVLDAPQKLPMLSYSWLSAYFEYLLPPEKSWFCLFAYSGNDLIGILPVIVNNHGVFGRNYPKLQTPKNNHIFSIDFISAKGMESDVIPFLFAGLKQKVPTIFSFYMGKVLDKSPDLSYLEVNTLKSLVFIEPESKCRYINTKGTFEEYNSKLSQNFKRNLKKSKNKLSQTGDVKVVFLSGIEATPKDLELFMEIESAGWKGRMGSAIKNSPITRDYYNKIVHQLAKLGWLEWHFLKLNEETIAGHFAVKMGRELIIYKIGYNEAYSEYSPGNYLFEHMLERAFNSDDTDVVNCLTDEKWHSNWCMETNNYYNFWIYPKSIVPLLFGGLPHKIKTFIRNIPGLRRIYKRLFA